MAVVAKGVKGGGGAFAVVNCGFTLAPIGAAVLTAAAAFVVAAVVAVAVGGSFSFRAAVQMAATCTTASEASALHATSSGVRDTDCSLMQRGAAAPASPLPLLLLLVVVG